MALLQTQHPSYTVRKFESAQQLPPEWDALATGYFQTKAFCVYNDRHNPCRQRYYLAYNREGAQAAALVYTLSVDLFTFSNIPSPLRMHIVGLPVSVSPPGIFGRKEGLTYLIDYLLNTEKGLLVGLNLDPGTNTGRGIKMRMLPTLELAHTFQHWADYSDQLRAPYRRRYYQTTAKWNQISVEETACSAFSNRHYQLYLDVLKHSTTKLETLQQPYFENLPDNFRLTTYSKNGDMLCWHITCSDAAADRLYFFFGGHNYRYNREIDAYFNNLLGVIREGIEAGFPKIDLGQTAEIPKMRLGGAVVPKVLFLYHRNPAVLFLLKKLKGLIEYRRVLPEHHVFHKTPQQETQPMLS